MMASNNESMRKVASLICLFALTILALYPCYLLAKTFFGPVLIAGMLGFVFYPIHTRIQSLVHRPTLASLVSTFLVFLVATIPLLLLGIAVRGELRAVVQSLQGVGPEGGLSPLFESLRTTAFSCASVPEKRELLTAHRKNQSDAA